MKTKLILFILSLLCSMGMWADGTWSSGNTADQANGQLSTIGWVKIKTPAGESGIKFSSFTFKHMGNSQQNTRLAFSTNKLNISTSISKGTFVGISKNFSGTANPNTTTYEFDEDVVLFGNAWYYLYFLKDNADGETYNLSTNGVAVQTGLTLTGDDVFHYSGSVTGGEATNKEWKPYYTCAYSSVDLSSVTVTYTCENLSGYTLVGSTESVIESGTKFTPPSAPTGYTLDGVYDDTDASFDYANTNIDADKTLKLKYHLTSNPFEDAKSTVASPTWNVIRMGTGNGDIYLTNDGTSPTPYIVLDSNNTSLSYPIDNNFLWCIEGNETAGYMIYNKAQTKYLGHGSALANGNVADSYKLALLADDPGNNPRWTLIYLGDKYYLYSVTDNKHINKAGTSPHYWSEKMAYGNGIAVFDALTLYQTAYPYSKIVNLAGYVGGYEVAEVESAQSAVSSTEPTSVDAYAAFVSPLTDKITLANGYYRIVSAVPGFNRTAAWYYNPSTSADYITWAKAATASEHKVNSIFKLSGSGTNWTIKSPNAQRFIAASPYNVGNNEGWTAQSCVMGNEGGTITITNIGEGQYTLKNYTQTMYAYGHSNGSGTSGTITNNNDNGLGGGSAWYFMKVDNITLTLNDGGDGYYYATTSLPFDVTLASACAYTLTLNGAKDGLTLSDAMSEVPAGTPVLLRHTTSSVEASIASDASTSAPLTSTALTGVYVNTDVSSKVATDYFLGKGDAGVGFYHWTGGTTLQANRAYFEASKIPGEVRAFYIFDLEDDATAIRSLTPALSEGEGAIYNIAGQKLSKLQKGINIVNGKKVLF